MKNVIKTSAAQLLAVPAPYGYVEALPAMAEHLTPMGQALARWYWMTDAVCEVRTVKGLIEQMNEVGIKAVDNDHDRYEDADDGDYVEHKGQRYAVYW